MRRIAMLALVCLTVAAAGCSRSSEPANTATGDTMSTGPSSKTNTATSANTDTTYTNPPAKTGTPVSATGT